MRIQIDHIAKIEGHLGFVGDIVNGRMDKAQLATQEGVRLIEGILRGRHYTEAPIITSRICGICPVVHNLTSIEALEDALGVKVSEETKKLRKLMQYAQEIHSHGLHLFFLSFPDFVGVSNDLDLVKEYPKETNLAVKVRDFGLSIVKTIGGRVVHPIRTEVGGFKKWPTKKELEGILKNYNEAMEASLKLFKLFKNLKYPKFERKTEYVSLGNNQEYAIYEGKVVSSEGLNVPVKEFLEKLESKQKSYNPEIKRASWQGKAYMVGALARLNNNFDKLSPLAKNLWPKEVKIPCSNSFYNILAQAIEVIHCLEECEKILKELVKKDLKNTSVKVKTKAGFGAYGMEAPRGTLYHAYELDDEGMITKCTTLPPTLQFLNNLEEDIKVLLNLDKLDVKGRREKIRTLIRAYDPCISCATH